MGIIGFFTSKDKDKDKESSSDKSTHKERQQKLLGETIQSGFDFGGDKKSPREAAIYILENEKKEMHIRDIAKIALKHHMTEISDLDELRGKISNALNSEVRKKNRKDIRVTKINRKGKKVGWYRIKKKRNTVKPPPQQGGEKGTVTAPVVNPISTSVIGTAGEYSIISELLFNGFNANRMIIDDGIDIIASKDNRHFFIQVKTSTTIRNNRVNFPPINEKSFSRYNQSGAFYVFVFRYNSKLNAPRCDYFIFSASDIESFRNQGILAMNADIRMKVVYESGKVYAYNGDNKIDVSYALNDFSSIK